MYNYIPHEPINTGFVFMRNTARVRDFLGAWKDSMEKALSLKNMMC